MNNALSSLESFDSGSNYNFGDKMKKNRNPRSVFDLSHLNSLTIPNCGMLVPISIWETIPGDDFDISVDSLLRVMPQVVPLYSRQRLYVYGFYSRYSDLWCNWQVFKDKGYTGADNRKIPTLHLINGDGNPKNVTYSTNETIAPDDLFDYIGLPIGSDMKKMFSDASNNPTANISALPFMMYLRIYRDYFMNKNHWINDRVMLPDDDSRFRLNDDGLLMSAVDQSKTFKFCTTAKNSGKYDLIYDSVNGAYTFSGAMHDYPDDYFTSALPFTQRGNTPLLNSANSDFSNLDFILKTNGDITKIVGATTPSSNYGISSNIIGDTGSIFALTNSATDSMKQNAVKNFGKALSQYKLSGDFSIGITLEDIRKLAIEQQMLEQLARTDGSYFQFGLSFFGEPSKAAYDFRPTYIGGCYKNIAFTEVLQTATTQTTQDEETVNNPTGAYAGHGITGMSNSRIGHIHCDDYGLIMIIACVMPDVYYSQGLDRLFTDSIEAEKYMPERALLGYQPIYNKEIYYAGNNGNSSGDDNYLWAYQNPFDNLRYIPNKIHGKIADSSNESFYPFTQARKFTQLPNWGREFSSTNDVRKDYLVAPSEDAYSAQFKMNIRAVRQLPYKAEPAQLVHF